MTMVKRVSGVVVPPPSTAYPMKEIAYDPDTKMKYHFINDLILVEEDTEDGHIEKVTLGEEEANKLSRMVKPSVKVIRSLMYEHSPYA